MADERKLALVADRYRLVRQLDADATALIWEARDTKLDRPVRLQILRPEHVDDSAKAEEFRRVMRAMAQSPSAYDAQVLDAGDDQASRAPFVVFGWAAAEETAPPAVELPAQPTLRVATVAERVPRPAVSTSSRSGVRPAVSTPLWSPRLLVLPLLAVPLVVGALLISAWLAQPESPVRRVFSLQPGTTVAPTPTAAPSAVPTRAATPTAPRPAATATPIAPIGERRRIANTDGIGVALRASPGGDRLPGKGYDEGVTVTMLEQQGTWARIRGDDGREGWVLSVTLVR
ncbi:MAG TPA: SH3 domain-containing protein [Chloroflexota bacterium]